MSYISISRVVMYICGIFIAWLAIRGEAWTVCLRSVVSGSAA